MQRLSTGLSAEKTLITVNRTCASAPPQPSKHGRGGRSNVNIYHSTPPPPAVPLLYHMDTWLKSTEDGATFMSTPSYVIQILFLMKALIRYVVQMQFPKRILGIREKGWVSLFPFYEDLKVSGCQLLSADRNNKNTFSLIGCFVVEIWYHSTAWGRWLRKSSVLWMMAVTS